MDQWVLLKSHGKSLVSPQHQIFWRVWQPEHHSLISPCGQFYFAWLHLSFKLSFAASVLAAVLGSLPISYVCVVLLNYMLFKYHQSFLNMTVWVVHKLIFWLQLCIETDSDNWPSCLFLWFLPLQVIIQENLLKWSIAKCCFPLQFINGFSLLTK